MEKEKEGCLGGEARIDAPSVIARLSAVSLTDTLHSRELLGNQSKDLSFAVASRAYRLSAMAHTSSSTFEGTSCVDASVVTHVEDDFSEMCVDVSHQVARVDATHATQIQDAVAQQGLDGKSVPCWAEMVPDALVKIFNHLPLESKLCTIPRVCQTWRLVSQGAPCWQTVDLSEWSWCKHPKALEKMLLLVVKRSQGCLLEICAPNLKNDAMLRLIADSGSQLKVLRIPDSFVSEECLCEVAPKFTSLTYLDISGRFPSSALVKSFGEHCPFITRLNVNMRLNVSDCKSCDTAAMSVAEYMPQLKHLEMVYGLLSNGGLKAIVEKCTSLEHLDLRGCWYVNMDEATSLYVRRRVKAFFAPVVKNDIYDTFEDEDDYDDFSVDHDDYTYDSLENYDDYDDMDFFVGCDIENMDEGVDYW